MFSAVPQTAAYIPANGNNLCRPAEIHGNPAGTLKRQRTAVNLNAPAFDDFDPVFISALGFAAAQVKPFWCLGLALPDFTQ